MLSVGCQSTGMKRTAKTTSAAEEPPKKLTDLMGLKKKKEPQLGRPERIVSTWAEAVLHDANGDATRGFGGRLFFYERASEEPIRVRGQLVVYAFEENDREPTDNRPTKRYVFPPEQLAKQESESEIGVSYSLWLPWDQVGGKQTEVSLIARFEPIQGGGLVVSDQTRHRLPGKITDTAIARASSPTQYHGVRQTSGISAAEGATQAVFNSPAAKADKPQLTTTTIPLPSRYQNRFKADGSVPAEPRSFAPPVATQPLGQTVQIAPGTTVTYRPAGGAADPSFHSTTPDSPRTSPPAASEPVSRPTSVPSR